MRMEKRDEPFQYLTRLTSGRIIGNLNENKYLIPAWEKLFAEYSKFIRYYLKKFQTGETTPEINLESFFTTNMLRKKVTYVFNDELPICDYKKNALSIEPSGDVQFCTSWDGQNFGNVFKDRVEKIWYSQKLQRLKTMKIKEITECIECELLSLCGGGCRLMANTITAKDLHACQKYKMFQQVILPTIRHLGIQLKS